MDSLDPIISFAELAAELARPTHAVKTAYSAGFLPIRSELRAGVRCFNRSDAEIFAALIAFGGEHVG